MLVTRPRACIVGPLLGSNEGWVVSQGEILARRLVAAGYEVLTTSSFPGRWRRLADICLSLVLRRKHFDLTIVMVFSGPAFWLARTATTLSHILRKPVILWLHGGNLPAYLSRHPRAAGIFTKAAHVVAPSSYLLEQASRFSSLSIIPNLLPDEGCTGISRDVVRSEVLWMRTFHPIYRPDLALDAFAVLRDRRPNVRLTMAGQDKGFLADSVRRAAELGLGDEVRFVGFAEDRQKRGLFAGHDIFLNTSATDNYPVSLVEAAAAGLVIVSSDVGGISAVFTDRVDALLIRDATPAALAEALEELFDEPALASSLSRGAISLAKRCTWAEVGPQWDRVLTEVSDARGRSQ